VTASWAAVVAAVPALIVALTALVRAETLRLKVDKNTAARKGSEQVTPPSP
jgi:hypothetical protein